MIQKKLITKQSDALDKSAWSRKHDKLQELVKNVNKISEKILELEAEKMPFIDEITDLRMQMINECCHPEEYLVEKEDGSIECKFCYKTIEVLGE